MLKNDDNNILWFKTARFGLFIHWGLYSATEGYWKGNETPGIGEWIAAKEKISTKDYEKLAYKMTCDRFNPSEWARLAKAAGMKYCVFTAKHHEGFAMYDTKYDDYSIVKRSPYGKDVARELVKAMRNEGITPCFYYSQAVDFHEKNAMGNTWDNPIPENDRDFISYINGKCKFQLKELLLNYGDIGIIWMDVPNGITEEIAIDLKRHVKSFQPKCLISGRISGTENMGDYGSLGDNQIPAGKLEGCWETASTMNDTWGYKRDDHNFKTPKQIIELLCSLLAKGTNLLLNIGPKANGEIPIESIYILQELAKWYKINGEAVSGTEASPFECDFSFGGASQKGRVIFLYVYDKVDEINIFGIENQVKIIRVLGGEHLDFKHDNNILSINTSDIEFDKYVTVIKIELDSAPRIRKGLFQQENDIILSASTSELIRHIEEKKKTILDGDVAVVAENYNTVNKEEMSISFAGTVSNWYSENNYLQWQVDVMEQCEYDIYLYTLTQKYSKWIGGHIVHLDGDIKTESKILTSDMESKGANKKYFDETGTFLGKAQLKLGKNSIKLIADKINTEDPVGLCVSKLVFIKA